MSSPRERSSALEDEAKVQETEAASTPAASQGPSPRKPGACSFRRGGGRGVGEEVAARLQGWLGH